MLVSDLCTRFKSLYSREDIHAVYFSPGRVNLIGEHIDYNGGRVLPCAIGEGTYAVVAKNDQRELRVCSLNFSDVEIKIFSLDDLEYRKEDDWANFPKGVFKVIRERFPKVDQGYDILFQGTLPHGAGLSSSASIEVLVAYMLAREHELPIDRVKIALLSQDVENRYIGVHCGIMDQFIIANAIADHALLLNCESLEYDRVPMDLGDYRIVIMNSNRPRTLAGSKYNERRAECEKALKKLQGHVAASNLCELSLVQLESLKNHIDPLLYKRAHHVVGENERVLCAVQALEDSNLVEFGRLMNASHDSLRDDYEVSGENLDLLVSLARAQEGVLGARMTGAGFSGCAIALVHKDSIDNFAREVDRHYHEKMGIAAGFYVAKAEEGVHCVQ